MIHKNYEITITAYIENMNYNQKKYKNFNKLRHEIK